MEFLTQPSTWIGLLTLTILEIVLGIDNIVFVSILSGKLKGEEKEKARKMGMGLAIIARIIMLFGIGFLVAATNPIFELPFVKQAVLAAGDTAEHAAEVAGISIKDIILFGGGLFLIYKSVKEIHHKLEGAEEGPGEVKAGAAFNQVLASIVGINIIFSLDSVITAVGMVKEIPVMIAAVVISGLFMIFYSGFVAKFVDKHPTVKILALAFLVLIGVNLMADAGAVHIPKGYTYFAMAFAVIVEVINIRVRGSNPVQLRGEEENYKLANE
jgi:predicted tellurium resistance membrane protein TerC